MFGIGQFAQIAKVSVRALRHYDDVGLLRPAAVDPTTGYRSYVAAQLPSLNQNSNGLPAWQHESTYS